MKLGIWGKPGFKTSAVSASEGSANYTISQILLTRAATRLSSLWAPFAAAESLQAGRPPT